MAEENTNQPKLDAEVKPLRTFQSDVEQILKEGEGSFARIAIAESEKRARGGGVTPETDTPVKSRIIISVSIGLAVLGLLILASLMFFRSASEEPVPVLEAPPLIVSDAQSSLDLSNLKRDAVLTALIKARDTTQTTLSSVTTIKLTERQGEVAKPIDTPKLFEKLGTFAPNELVRSFDPNFAFGLHALNRNQPFLILKTDSYQNAFAGMLLWEKTLIRDLGSIFVPETVPIVATSSEQVTKADLKFEDIVIKNRDTRSVRGENGQIIFLYSFIDKNTIVITNNQDTFDQVMARLLAGKLVQ